MIRVYFIATKMSCSLKEILSYDFKRMLRRNIEHFLQNPIWEKLGISEIKKLKKAFFFYFQPSVFFIFAKI